MGGGSCRGEEEGRQRGGKEEGGKKEVSEGNGRAGEEVQEGAGAQDGTGEEKGGGEAEVAGNHNKAAEEETTTTAGPGPIRWMDQKWKRKGNGWRVRMMKVTIMVIHL